MNRNGHAGHCAYAKRLGWRRQGLLRAQARTAARDWVLSQLTPVTEACLAPDAEYCDGAPRSRNWSARCPTTSRAAPWCDVPAFLLRHEPRTPWSGAWGGGALSGGRCGIAPLQPSHHSCGDLSLGKEVSSFFSFSFRTFTRAAAGLPAPLRTTTLCVAGLLGYAAMPARSLRGNALSSTGTSTS